MAVAIPLTMLYPSELTSLNTPAGTAPHNVMQSS